MGSPQSTQQQQPEEQSASSNQEAGDHREAHEAQNGQHTTPAEPPSKPKPENDAAIVPQVKSPSVEEEPLTAESIDIFTLQPVSALRLLCRNIDALVQMTGDVPPTPPIRSRTQSPSRASYLHSSTIPIPTPDHNRTTLKRDMANLNIQIPRPQHHTPFANDSIDGVPFKRTPIGSPEAEPFEPTSPEHQDIGYNAAPLHIQYGALARKFYSKRPPPITTTDYLLRMHKYCPMSPAVYLATSVYITQLSCVEKILPVTPRNVHRLLLAGLRVAMKALEDLSWPHSRFSKVGGVSEAELGRLEVTFCFLMDFGLKVDRETLQREAEALCRAGSLSSSMTETADNDAESAITDGGEVAGKRGTAMELRMPLDRRGMRSATAASGVGSGAGAGTASTSEVRTPEKRKASSALPHRPAGLVGTGGIEVLGHS